MNTSLVESRGQIFEARPDSSDDFVIHENSYKAVFSRPAGPNDRWIDVGAHIGTFACRVALQSFAVLAIEPSRESFDILQANVQRNRLTNVQCLRAAVVADEIAGEDVSLALSSRNAGSNRVGRVRGRVEERVPSVSILPILDEFQPNKLKIDCEGGERAIFNDLIMHGRLANLDEIAFEWHFNVLRDDSWRQYRLVERELGFAGFVVHGPVKQSKRWTAVVHAFRE